ncbi:MAG TPA: hotdog domain-containing protein, partial [Polyangiales bacterium]
FVVDECPIQFGLTHTDANQHVNSLVYARLFEEAALRRLHALGEGTALLGRRIELNYRKPCFAGDRMRFAVRSYRRQGELGATGFLAPEGAGIERAHCSFDLLFGAR